MSQQEVILYLEKNPKKHSVEIADALRLCRSSVSCNLRKLVDSGEVIRVEDARKRYKDFVYVLAEK